MARGINCGTPRTDQYVTSREPKNATKQLDSIREGGWAESGMAHQIHRI